MNCSFCGTSQAQAGRLISGPGVQICDTCVRLCVQIIEGAVGVDPQVETRLREHLAAALERLGVEVEAEAITVTATDNGIRVDVHTTRPGLIIGRRGVTADRLRAGLAEFTDGPLALNIVAVP